MRRPPPAHATNAATTASPVPPSGRVHARCRRRPAKCSASAAVLTRRDRASDRLQRRQLELREPAGYRVRHVGDQARALRLRGDSASARSQAEGDRRVRAAAVPEPAVRPACGQLPPPPRGSRAGRRASPRRRRRSPGPASRVAQLLPRRVGEAIQVRGGASRGTRWTRTPARQRLQRPAIDRPRRLRRRWGGEPLRDLSRLHHRRRARSSPRRRGVGCGSRAGTPRRPTGTVVARQRTGGRGLRLQASWSSRVARNQNDASPGVITAGTRISPPFPPAVVVVRGLHGRADGVRIERPRRLCRSGRGRVARWRVPIHPASGRSRDACDRRYPFARS